MAEDPDKYLPLFIAEASEQLELLTSELVRIEQEPAGGAVWDSIFRRVHSVKGSAATLGLTAVVEIAHSAETLIGKLKAQNHKPERGQVDLLLQATDALVSEIQRASARLERSRREETGNSAQLLARLSDASRSLPAPAPSPPPPVQKAEAAVDPALPRLDVFFSLSRACQAPGARALIVQRKLKALGTLLEIEPTPQALMQKKGGVRVSALLATSRPSEAVAAAFDGIPEVENVQVRLAPLTSAPQPQAAAEPKTRPTRPITQTPVAEEVRVEATVRVRAQALDQLLDQAAEVLHGIARLREQARYP